MLIKNIKPVLFTLAMGLLSLQLMAQNPGFVQTDVIKVAGVTTDAQINALPLGNIQTTRVFIDGLGRPVQAVGLQASPVNNKDIVQPEVYNTLGQQTTGYLPYADNAATHPTGSFRTTAITDLASYYNNSGTSTNPNAVANETTYPYSQQVFENSPMQRVTTAGMVGSGFQPGVSGNKSKSISYRLNNSTQDGSIMLWTTSGTYTSGTNYADNTLYVTDGIDEDGIEARVFTDAAGRTILKRQLNSGSNVDTYYVYNVGGVISYIIPPQALAAMVSSGNYSLSAGPVNTMIFIFTYDSMGRPIEKTVPAKGKMNIVYDPMNRPVLTQDANMQTSNKWAYVKYDIKGRAINSGTYTDATHTSRSAMQTYVNGLASSYNTLWYEVPNNSGTYNFYSNNVFPTTITPLSYTYYDDYDINNTSGNDFTYSTKGLTGETGATTAPVKGMVTAMSQTTVGSGIATNKWFTKAMFYDKRGNPIQVQSSNPLSYVDFWTMTDFATTVPDFMGVPQVTLVSQKSSSTVTTTVQTNFTYDYFYRLKAVDQYYNGSATVSHVASYSYNEMGQLVKKSLGYVSATSWLQNVDMRYNIRGMLTSINNSTLAADGGLTNTDTNDAFGMSILYEQVDANLSNSSFYNGRISGVKWMSLDGSGTKSAERSYKFGYDGLQRLTASTYQERVLTTGSFGRNLDGFDETVSYDIGGNVTGLVRNSSTQGTNSGYTQIDNLVYTYDSSDPYRLQKVTDGTDANHTGAGFRNLTGNTIYTYSYDTNGNMTIDPNKGLSLGYNILNKTDKITVTAGTNRWTDYTYAANGTLLRKRQFDVSATTPVTTTDYIDGFVYVTAGAGTPTLQYFPMPDGRVLNTGTASAPVFTQEYIITDQQGNARVSFQNNGSGVAIVKQENSYYPSGLIMPNSPVATPTIPNKQLYNGGSEWQNDYNNLPDYYQTLNRNYDAALMRFIAVDPIAESAESMTTYQYAGNNPVMFNDPLGNQKANPTDYPDYYKPLGLPALPQGGGYMWAVDDSGPDDVVTSFDNLGKGPGAGDPTAEFWQRALAGSGFSYSNGKIVVDVGSNTGGGIQLSSVDDLLAPYRGQDLYFSSNGDLVSHTYDISNGRSGIVAKQEGSVAGQEMISVDRLVVLLLNNVSDNNGQWDGEKILSDIWNSAPARAMVPDDISLNISANFSFVVGTSFTGAVHMLTRGQDVGFHVTGSMSYRTGWEAGASVNISDGWFMGDSRNATFESLLGRGYDISGNYLIFSGSLWESARNNNPLTPSWVGYSAGVGVGLGGSGGASNTVGN